MSHETNYDLVIDQLEITPFGAQLEYFSTNEIEDNNQLQQKFANIVIILIYLEILLYLSLYLVSRIVPNLTNHGWIIILTILLWLLIRFSYISNVSRRMSKVMNMDPIDTAFVKTSNMIHQSRFNLLKLISFTILLMFLNLNVAIICAFTLLSQMVYFIIILKSLTQRRYPIFTKGIWYNVHELQHVNVSMTRFPIFVSISSGIQSVNVSISSSSLKFAMDKYPYNFSNYFLELYDLIETKSVSQSMIKYIMIIINVPLFLGAFFYPNLKTDFGLIYLFFALFLILNLLIVGGSNLMASTTTSDNFLTSRINQYFDSKNLSFERRIDVLQDYLDFIARHDPNPLNIYADRSLPSKIILAYVNSIRPTYSIKSLKRIIDRYTSITPKNQII